MISDGLSSPTKMPGSGSTSPRMFEFFVSLTGISHCLHCTLTAGFTTSSGCSMALKLAVTAYNFVEECSGLYILNQNHDMSLQHVMVFTWKPTVVLHKTQTLQSLNGIRIKTNVVLSAACVWNKVLNVQNSRNEPSGSCNLLQKCGSHRLLGSFLGDLDF